MEKGAHSFLEDTMTQKRKNSLRERLKNVPGDVISPSSDFREKWVSQMTVLSVSSGFVVDLQ